MKERPILFSGPMVRAILEGRKTQTRRVVKPQLGPDATWAPFEGDWRAMGLLSSIPAAVLNERIACPQGQHGDRLWVRETWAPMHPHSAGKLHASRATALYKATCDCDFPDKWRPSIFMPRSASRITLEIVSVRVDRLHDISEEDARNEGHEGRGVTRYESEARDWFRGLWDSINGKRAGCSWSDSPWVWVIEFRRVEK